MKTWKAELFFVVMALALTVIYMRGGWVEWLGAIAVCAGFAHAQVTDRLAEHSALTEKFAESVSGERWRLASCWRWATRYFVAKEFLWLGYFVAHKSWSALVGVFVFLVYPVWRRIYRNV